MTATYLSKPIPAQRPAPDSADTVIIRPAATSKGRHGFRKDIEGLRAVAVLLVVAFHAGVSPLTGGYVGVDVFFVISGFLITTLLYQELERHGRISLTRFYGRRMIRLLPASTIVVVGTLAAAWHWMPPLTAKLISGDALAASVHGVNLKFAIEGTDYLASGREPSPLQHFWSLAVEEQFYLVWPLLLMVASLAWWRRGKPSVIAASATVAMVVTASFALCVWLTTESQPWAYFGLPARAWELGIGALVALVATRLAGMNRVFAAVITWTGLAAVLTSAFVFTEATLFPGYAAALPVFGTAMVIAGGCAEPRGGVEAVLRIGPLQEIGRLSYSWYLWHWPILILAPHVAGREPGVWVKVGLMAVALIPASMSLAAVENRIRFQRIFQARPQWGIVLGGSLTACIAGLALVTVHVPVTISGKGTAADTASVVASGQSSTVNELDKLIRMSTSFSNLPANLTPTLTAASRDHPRDGNCIAPLDETSIRYNIDRGCERRGEVTGTRTVAIFGDSHARQWYDALSVLALQRKFRLVVFTKGGCTPAAASNLRGDTQTRYVECERWREEALKRIAEIRPEVVVISSLTYHESVGGSTAKKTDEWWAHAFATTFSRIREFGAKPIWIHDTPRPSQNVPECLSVNSRKIQACSFPATDASEEKRRRAMEGVAAEQSVQVIDPRPWFCTASICPAVVGNTLVYLDDDHVTATYMKLLASRLAHDFQ